jgi:hypothetical protein
MRKSYCILIGCLCASGPGQDSNLWPDEKIAESGFEVLCQDLYDFRLSCGEDKGSCKGQPAARRRHNATVQGQQAVLEKISGHLTFSAAYFHTTLQFLFCANEMEQVRCLLDCLKIKSYSEALKQVDIHVETFNEKVCAKRAVFNWEMLELLERGLITTEKYESCLDIYYREVREICNMTLLAVKKQAGDRMAYCSLGPQELEEAYQRLNGMLLSVSMQINMTIYNHKTIEIRCYEDTMKTIN